MKRQRNLIVTGVALGVLLLGSAAGLAATVNVTVDPALTWVGYMNVYELPENGSGFQWGSPWGTPDLPAVFTGPNLKLSPNTNVYNAADPYWVKPDGSGNKWMEANAYVEDPGLGGNELHFYGLTLTNSLVAPYASVAFIKEFTPGYGLVQMVTVPLTTGSFFDVFATITPGNIAQYGFMTTGPDANPATVEQFGHVLVTTPEPAALALLALGLVLRRR